MYSEGDSDDEESVDGDTEEEQSYYSDIPYFPAIKRMRLYLHRKKICA